MTQGIFSDIWLYKRAMAEILREIFFTITNVLRDWKLVFAAIE